MAAAFAVATPASAQETKRFDVAAQDAASALRAAAIQGGFEILIPPNVVAGKKANALRGDFPPAQALGKLLEGTGLTVRAVGPRTYVVEDPKRPADPQNPTNPAQAPSAERRGEAADGAGIHRLEPITVTAQKRDERAFDVPISIAVMSGLEMEKRRVASIDDLAMAVPGLAIQTSGGYQRRIMMRGISNTFGTSSLIGVYLDEAPVTSLNPVTQLNLQTYDLERVEVLRGPQGTLYGEGSAGGTVRFITRDPRLDRFAMSADVAATWTHDGAPGQLIETMLNVPLIADELGIRVAGTFDHRGGWIDQPAADRRDYNDQNLVDVRVKGLWRPSANFWASAMALVHRNDTAPNVGEDANGNYTQTFNLLTTPSVRDTFEVYNVTLAYDFPFARLLGTASYVEQEKALRNQGFRFGVAPGAPRPDALFHPDTRFGKKHAEELRLTSTGSGPWQWTAGAFYQDARADRDVDLYFALAGPPGSPLPAPFNQQERRRSKSWSVFADTSFRFTDRLTAGAGIRYFEDDMEFTAAVAGTPGPTQTRTFDSVDPRLYLQYKVHDDVNTYASVAKGFRSGGFNAAGRPPFDPESVVTYELGTKMSLLDGRLSLEAALFYSDYTEYQIVGFVPVGTGVLNITSNAGSAKVKGIEWATSWRAAPGLTLGLNGTYIDSRFYEINAADSSHAVGDPLDLFPKYTYTIFAQHDFSWNGMSGFARVDYNEQGRMYYRNRRSGPWLYSESDVINMLNVNVGLDVNKSLTVGMFVQNLLDDRGYTDPFAIDENAARARPRTFGVRLGVKF